MASASPPWKFTPIPSVPYWGEEGDLQRKGAVTYTNPYATPSAILSINVQILPTDNKITVSFISHETLVTFCGALRAPVDTIPAGSVLVFTWSPSEKITHLEHFITQLKDYDHFAQLDEIKLALTLPTQKKTDIAINTALAAFATKDWDSVSSFLEAHDQPGYHEIVNALLETAYANGDDYYAMHFLLHLTLPHLDHLNHAVQLFENKDDRYACNDYPNPFTERYERLKLALHHAFLAEDYALAEPSVIKISPDEPIKIHSAFSLRLHICKALFPNCAYAEYPGSFKDLSHEKILAMTSEFIEGCERHERSCRASLIPAIAAPYSSLIVADSTPDHTNTLNGDR